MKYEIRWFVDMLENYYQCLGKFSYFQFDLETIRIDRVAETALGAWGKYFDGASKLAKKSPVHLNVIDLS